MNISSLLGGHPGRSGRDSSDVRSRGFGRPVPIAHAHNSQAVPDKPVSQSGWPRGAAAPERLRPGVPAGSIQGMPPGMSHEPGRPKGTRRSQQRPDRTLILVAVGLIAIVAAFFSSYASALGKPSARHLPVAVTAPPAVIGELRASPALTVHAVPDLASARRMVEDRAVYGALALPRTGPITLLVANGGGHAVAVILRQLGQQIARARGTQLKTYDVAPASGNDPNGTVEFDLLVFVGLVMVFSASAVMAQERFGSEYAFLSKQLIWAGVGLIAMVVTMRLDYRRYKHPALVFSLMGLTTLLLISVFFLDRSHNTHRWIHAGGFSFQPSELAKPVLILFLAYFLETRAKTIDDVRNTLVPAAHRCWCFSA